MASAGPAPAYDAHLHPSGVSDADLASMRIFGVEGALLLADPLADPTPRRLLDAFDRLLEVELPRVERAGIEGHLALGVHPGSIPRRGLLEVLAALPERFRGKVIALGEIGLFRGGEEEEEALTEQLALAQRLQVPVVIHTPTGDKERLTRRLLAILRDSGLPAGQVLVDHVGPRTVRPVLACGYWAGLSIHPEAMTAEGAVAAVKRLGPERLVFDSDAGAGASDILGLGRAVHLLSKAKLSRPVVARVSRENARRFLRLAPA